MVDIIPFSIYNTFNPNVSQSITKEGIFMTRTKKSGTITGEYRQTDSPHQQI